MAVDYIGFMNRNRAGKFSWPVTLFLAVALFGGCTSTGPLARQEVDFQPDQVNTRGLFVENCAMCHGKDGRAKTFHGCLVGAQNLTDMQWQEKTTDDEIIHAIKTGPGAMPAFENKLSPSEIQALATYVRSLAEGS